jgi:glycosyltransferase involved in cell wall biosynthesis
MTSNKPPLLLVCRMSPRINGRARALIEALENDYDITAVSERPRNTSTAPPFQHAKLLEYQLFLDGRSVLHIAGALRVVQLNLLGLLAAWRIRPAAVIGADVPYCFAALLAKLMWRCRVVFDSYEIIWGLGDGWFFSNVFRWLERLVLKYSGLWLVPSPKRAEIVMEAHNMALDFQVIPNIPAVGPLTTAEMRSRLRRAGIPDDGVTILFQGSLLPRRGLRELIQAAAGGEFHLIVQGDGPERPFVEASAGPHVTVLPACPNQEAASWLSAVTASFVYYENDCINSAWACSSKLYTSMIAGTPVLCNDLPAFREFQQEHGACVVLETFDATSIARGVRVFTGPVYQELKAQAAAAGAALSAFPRAAILKAALESVLHSPASSAPVIPESHA